MQEHRPSGELRLWAMLLPVIVYDLALQAIRIVGRCDELLRDPAALTPLNALHLLSSPLFANGALVLGCGGLLAVSSGRGRRWLLSGIQTLLAVLVVLQTAAHVYFMRSGGNLDTSLIAYWAPRFQDLELVASGEVSGAEWAAMVAVLLVLVALPRFVARVQRSPGRTPTRTAGVALLASSAVLGCAGYRLRPSQVLDAGAVRDPVFNLVESALRSGPDLSQAHLSDLDARLPFELQLRPTRAGRPPNVVLVILESTRAQSLTPWNPALATTPFLNELAPKSLVVERFHAVVPHTSKAMTAILCGLQPSHSVEPMAVRLGLASRCLPRLLREQGYETAYFQSATGTFEDRERTVSTMGFERFVTPQQYPDRGFQRANFLGPEDEALLDPMIDWLRDRKEKPFLLTFLTVNAHHQVFPLTRHGVKRLDPDDQLNNYLNAIRYDDLLLRKLVDGLKRLGLYRDTILVVVGDHGDAYEEHGMSVHDLVPYEEVLHIPLLIHDPREENPKPLALREPANQIDLLPTLVELLGFEAAQGAFQGKSLLHLVPGRPLMASCYGNQVCLARLQGSEKFIHHFGRRPDQLFDLEKDPAEREDLAPSRPQRVDQLRGEVLAWDRAVKALYFFYSQGQPRVQPPSGPAEHVAVSATR
jgi:lipoteichoic acid synthase